MMESSYIIRLNIEHYQALLRLDSITEMRPTVIKLLAEAQAQLPLAQAEELECGRQSGFRAA
jgi:hypothetical protein